MSAREFLEWQVYDALEGLPARRAEWGTALLTATLANVHRKKGAKPFRPDDFLMRDPAPAKPPRALKSGNLSGFFAALDALADRPKKGVKRNGLDRGQHRPRHLADVAQLKTDLAKANRTVEDFAGSATKSLSALTKTAGSFMSAFAGIGIALGGASLATLAKQAIEAADNIGDMAERLGVGTDALQALQYAARDVGADAEGLTTGIAKLNKLLGEAGAGNKEAIKSFADLGVAFGEAGKLRSTEDVLRSVADRIAGAGSVAEKTRLAVEVFGKSGAALVPIFAKGAAGIDELVAKLREMGIIIDGTALKQADALQKQFDQLAATIQTALIKAVLAAGPALAALATETQKSVEWFARLIDRVAALAAAPFGTVETRLKSLRAELENLQKIGMPGDVRVPQVQARIKALEAERDLLNEQKREGARAGQTGGGPSGTALVAPKADPGAAKAAAALAKKAREEKQDADTKAVADSITLEERMRDEGQKTFDFLEKLGQETATARGDAAMEEAARVAHGLAMEEKFKADIASDVERVNKETDAILAAEQVRADKRIQLEQETTFAINKMNEDAAKETADRQAKMLEPFMKLTSTVFDAFDRALSTSVTGIIQGTVTLETALKNMSQSIGASLVEGIIKDGLDLVREGIKEFLKSQMVKDLLQMVLKIGLAAVGGAYGTSSAPVQLSGPGMDLNTYGSGGIVTRKEMAILGESGPEVVVPLDRMDEMGGDTSVVVNIIDQRSGGGEGGIQQSQRTGPDGQRQIDILITDTVRKGMTAGAYDRELGMNFGMKRRAVSRTFPC